MGFHANSIKKRWAGVVIGSKVSGGFKQVFWRVYVGFTGFVCVCVCFSGLARTNAS